MGSEMCIRDRLRTKITQVDPRRNHVCCRRVYDSFLSAVQRTFSKIQIPVLPLAHLRICTQFMIMERSISPPPKRRKLSRSDAKQGESNLNVLTIYSWNVNGIQPLIQQPITSFFSPQSSHQKVNDTSLRGFLRRHEWPTFLFLQEIKISPNDLTSIRALEKAVRRDKKAGNTEPDYVVHVNLPSDKFNARGYVRKLYGVCSVIRQDFADRWVERVRPVEWDLEGRFLVTELKGGSRMQRLALINAYMVSTHDHLKSYSKLTQSNSGQRYRLPLQRLTVGQGDWN